MEDRDIHRVMELLERAVEQWDTPAVTIVSQREGNPFKVLISCILSLRTQDRTTGPASERLFALADTPAKLAGLPEEDIARAIYPVGFYRVKARTVQEISRTLLERYGGEVPRELDELLKLKGVGRKTANLVVTLGFGSPGICVDTHVHRICNRLGYVDTRTPDETERVLRGKLPQQYWLAINDLLVTFGQNLCTPLSPRCSACPLRPYCDRRGVTRSR
ncbi:MAG TPA: endonuclease III [Verrucomicrobiae bacterium]|nr:endonuclease III [Verrucomicrobiae bacterium]